jgi:hypothetical protein
MKPEALKKILDFQVQQWQNSKLNLTIIEIKSVSMTMKTIRSK